MAGARSVADDGTTLDDPPPRVVGDARSAFRDAITDGVPLRPDCDSWDDQGTKRALLFRCRGCALVIECRTVPDGIRVSGAAFGTRTLVSVIVRRPGRPFLRLTATADGRFGPVTVPRGLASFATEYSDNGVPAHWHSDWLKL